MKLAYGNDKNINTHENYADTQASSRSVITTQCDGSVLRTRCTYSFMLLYVIQFNSETIHHFVNKDFRFFSISFYLRVPVLS